MALGQKKKKSTGTEDGKKDNNCLKLVILWKQMKAPNDEILGKQ